MYKIGNVKLKGKVFLAPLAGVNCASFRQLCHEYGAGLVYTQLYHSEGVISLHDQKRLKEFLNVNDKERPASIQLVGNDGESMGEATKIISKYADIIDINLGCPDQAVLAKRAGAFFSKHPEQIPKIVESVVENSKVPVTAKIRTGWDDKEITFEKSVKILNELNVDAIAIHGRTRKQVYEGKANWKYIKKAKEISDVPIIGNGDIFKPGNAKAMIEQTKCDFVMIGRGSMGNPLLFDRAHYLLENGENKEEPTSEEKKKVFFRFVELYEKVDKNKSFAEFKQHAMWFTKGLENSRRKRDKILRMSSFEDIIKYMDACF